MLLLMLYKYHLPTYLPTYLRWLLIYLIWSVVVIQFHPVLLAKNITPPPKPEFATCLGRAPPPFPPLAPEFAVLALQIRSLLVEGLLDVACLPDQCLHDC